MTEVVPITSAFSKCLEGSFNFLLSIVTVPVHETSLSELVLFRQYLQVVVASIVWLLRERASTQAKVVTFGNHSACDLTPGQIALNDHNLRSESCSSRVGTETREFRRL